MSAAPQTAPSAPRQPSSKQQTARGSKEKQQQQTHPKPSAPPVAPAPSKEKENLTAEARRGRHSLPATTSANATVNGPESKKVARRSSKPIFDWFQRKLAGTVRARRASESARSNRAHGATTSASARDKKRPPLPNDFHALTRTHSTPSRNRSSGDRNVRRLSHAVENPNSLPIPGAVSLNDDDDDDDFGEERARENSTYRSSLAHDSLWAPTSNLEADEDASVRPLPPSSPPSPSPSRSSSSYLSDPRTFRSLAASTKPTTLLSVDLANGMAHIAQAPSTPSSTFQRMGSHTRSGGGNGGGNGGGGSISSAAAPISFSVLPVGHSPSTSVSGEPSPAHHQQTRATSSTQPVQAPQLTHYHPRNNPRPSSPPLDNASVLTLASSAFGIPGARPGIVASADAMSVSQFSHFGGSRAALHEGDRASGVGVLLGDEFVFEAGADRDRDRDRDVDASVRALRPRSSRRGSWESEASGWSAKMGPAGGSTVAIGPDTPGHDRSLFWAASVRTGEFDDAEGSVAAGSVGAEPSSLGEDLPSTEPLLNGVAQEVEVEVDDGSLADSSAQQTPRKDILVEGESDEDDEREQEKETTSIRDAATPRYAPVELAAVESPPALPSSISSDSADTAATVEPLKPFEERVVHADDAPEGYLGAGAQHGQSAEVRSLAPSESTDVFVSAPSTPLPSLPVTPAAA